MVVEFQKVVGGQDIVYLEWKNYTLNTQCGISSVCNIILPVREVAPSLRNKPFSKTPKQMAKICPQKQHHTNRSITSGRHHFILENCAAVEHPYHPPFVGERLKRERPTERGEADGEERGERGGDS